AAAASASAASTDADDAGTARTAAEAAQAAAEAAQAAAEAAAGANDTAAAQIAAASELATPDDTDLVGVVDVSASNVMKKTTWTQIKAFLKTYFDTLYSAVGHTHSFSSLTSKPTTLSGYNIS